MDTALQEHPAHLVDHRGAAHNPPLTHAVQRLQVELIVVPGDAKVEESRVPRG